MTLTESRLTDPDFLRYVAETATPQEREYFGPFLAESLAKRERLSLQPKQREAERLSLQVDALLYGGAAGGGKTHWLLVHMAKQMLDHPGNRGAIFRRVFPSLNRSIVPRAVALLQPWATYNKVEHIFTFHNGSILELGSLEGVLDVEKYQGAEYGVVAFEEVTEFHESQVDYFKTRLRAPVPGVHPHMIATTNPGGVGHKWVKREWVKPEASDVVEGASLPMTTWKARPKGEEKPQSRCYVPATLEDNPALLERDPEYRDRLRSIKDKKKREAYEKGNWDAIDKAEGALWSDEDLDLGRVWETPRVNMRIIAVDPSDGDESADGFGVTVAVKGEDGHCYIEWNDEWHNSPAIMARSVIDLYWEVGAGEIVIEKNFGGKWIPALIKEIDKRVNVETVTASEGKMTRAKPVAALFEPGDDKTPTEAHLVGNHSDLEEELTNYTAKPGEKSPDRLDSMVWAVTRLMFGAPKPRMRFRG